MPEKDPALWSAGAWWVAALMAAGGGFVNWFSRLRAEGMRRISFCELAGEMATSAFTGIGTAMILVSMHCDPLWCFAGAGVGGHMATRLLFRVENLVNKFLERMGRKIDDHEHS